MTSRAGLAVPEATSPASPATWATTSMAVQSGEAGTIVVNPSGPSEPITSAREVWVSR